MPDTNAFVDKGQLRIAAVSAEGSIPVENATVEISLTGEPEQVIEQLQTDRSGNTETIDLGAPALEYSLEPGDTQPYSEYNLKITAPGFEEVMLAGVQILSGQSAISNIRMIPVVTETPPYNPLVIAPHTLWKLYPPKIAEAEIKELETSNDSLTATLQKLQSESAVKKIQDFKLQQDYKEAKALLDSIPPEILRAYKNRAKQNQRTQEVK